MSQKYSRSTYVVPVTVRDQDGNRLPLNGARIDYVMTEFQSDKNPILEYNDSDPELTIDEELDGEFKLEIPPSEMDVPRSVWEEVRISFPGGQSSVILQREVQLKTVSSDPPENL